MPNDQPETLDAILAEMRASARDSFASKLVAKYEETGRLDEVPAAQALKDDDAYLVQLASRIEAAAERERDENRQLAAITESDEAFARCARCDRPEHAHGNAAAMREALVEIVLLTLKAGISLRSDVACGIVESKARHALAAPARNCDVGSEKEQAVRKEAYCLRHSPLPTDNCDNCPLRGYNRASPERAVGYSCDLAWGQLPYTPAEGGAK